MKKLLTLFTLLLCVCSGAWAADPVTILDFSTGTPGDVFTISNNDGGTAGNVTNAFMTSSEASDFTGKTWTSPNDRRIQVTKILSNSAYYSILTTKSSYTDVKRVAFQIISTDKGSKFTVQISSKADFSSDVTTIQAETSLNTAGVGGNNQWLNFSKDLATQKSGYIRIKIQASSAGKIIGFTDFAITEAEAAPAIPTLTGEWKRNDVAVTEADVIVQGDDAPTMPTFTVGATSGTPDAGDYTVNYSFKSGYTPGIFAETAGNPTIVNGQPSIASTSVVGSATIVATLASLHTEDYEDADPNTFEYTVTVNAPATPITLAWDKSSDIVATNSVVTAPVFSNNGGLEVNTTNFNFAITGTEGIISVADNGIVTINSSVKGVATVTASVKASGYSADPVAYTIRVADAATKWDFTTVEGTVDEYNLSADAAGDGILWTYDSSNKRYKNKYDSENHTDLIPTANSNYLTVAEGLLLSWNAADRFRIDIKYNRAWVNGGAVIKITNLKAGQKVSVSHKASGSSNYPRGFETSNLSNTSDFSLNDTNDHTATGYVTADGTVTLTAQGGGTYLYTITVEDYVPVTIGDAGYATFSSTEKLNFTGVSGLTAYKATATSGSSVTLEDVTGVVPAETGLLLKGAKATYYIPVSTAAATADVTGNKLQSTASAAHNITNEEVDKAFVFGSLNGNVGFYKAAEGKTIGVGKSYLLLSGTGAKDVEFLSFVFGDEEQGETDGIKAVSTKIENGVRYNLAGQKVGADYKGIVIVNGKKMLNK